MRRSMWRATGAAVVALALSAGMAGCGNDTTPATEPPPPAATEPANGGDAAPPPAVEPGVVPDSGDADLVIWSDDNRAAALAAPAAAWGAANGLNVVVQAIPDNLQGLAITADQAGNGPDILIGANDWLGLLTQNGSIVPVTIPDTSDFSDVALDAARFGGQLFAVPYATETIALFANADLVPDHTAPATFEEMIAAGEASGAERALCLQIGNQGDAYHMQPLYTSAGGYIFGHTADGDWNPADIGVDSPGGLAAADKLAELGREGILSTAIDGTNSIPLFTTGDCAYLISGPWAIDSLNSAHVNYTISAIPPFEGGQPAQPMVGVQNFMVMAHGQNQAFAQQFVQDVAASPDIARQMFQVDQRVPAQISLMNELTAQYPDIAKFGELADGGQPMPDIPEMGSVWEPLGLAQANVIDGADPHTTFQAAANQIRTAIG